MVICIPVFLLLGGAFGRMALLLLSVFIIVYVAFQVIAEIKKAQEKKSFQESQEGKITEKVNYCRTQISLNKREIVVINQDIKELELSLQGYHEVNPANQKEAEKLIAAFEKERELRQLKIDFFRACLKKIATLSHNHNLTKTLFDKQESLRKLKEQNIEDIADLESFKSDIAYDKGYLETIDDLSRRMYQTGNLPDAERVQIELELLTKELKEL